MQNQIQKSTARVGALAALALGAIAFASPLLAQEPAAGELKPGETKVESHSKSMLEIWHEGGWVMYPLAACSIALVWLTVDTWMRTSPKSMAPPAHMQQLQDLFRAGDYVGAYQFAKNNPSPACDVSRFALSFLGDGHTAVEYNLLDSLTKVNGTIQTRINYLSVIGVCTPMIGLVGTVMGMMKAFANMGDSGIGDPSGLAAAIGEVLIATASGLAIAIPAFMMFYVLRNKLQAAMHGLQEEVTALFRKMPWAHLKDCHVGEEEFFAATPNWVTGGATPAGEPAAH
jgi:biopolymer transport protein ExbB